MIETIGSRDPATMRRKVGRVSDGQGSRRIKSMEASPRRFRRRTRRRLRQAVSSVQVLVQEVARRPTRTRSRKLAPPTLPATTPRAPPSSSSSSSSSSSCLVCRSVTDPFPSPAILGQSYHVRKLDENGRLIYYRAEFRAGRRRPLPPCRRGRAPSWTGSPSSSGRGPSPA